MCILLVVVLLDHLGHQLLALHTSCACVCCRRRCFQSSFLWSVNLSLLQKNADECASLSVSTSLLYGGAVAWVAVLHLLTKITDAFTSLALSFLFSLFLSLRARLVPKACYVGFFRCSVPCHCA